MRKEHKEGGVLKWTWYCDRAACDAKITTDAYTTSPSTWGSAELVCFDRTGALRKATFDVCGPDLQQELRRWKPRVPWRGAGGDDDAKEPRFYGPGSHCEDCGNALDAWFLCPTCLPPPAGAGS